MRHQRLDAARDVLNRALKALPKRKHVKTIVKFAQFEYKFGEPERGMTIFERIVTNHPKRIDLWIVYIDKEIASQDAERVRYADAVVVPPKVP
jgi:rRNA biogenesis protein RRP5